MLSRVADHLYWMSRYLERAEHTSRIIGVHLNAKLDISPGISPQERLGWLLACANLNPRDFDLADEDALLQSLTFHANGTPSVLGSITAARENARQVREQISSEMWTQINRLYLQVKTANINRIWNGQPFDFFVAVKEGSHLFQGITDATMNHNQGWHFIQAGRYIERAISLATMLDAYLGNYNTAYSNQEIADQYFTWLVLLKSATAFEAYTKVYNADLRPDWIAEFLLFNPEFPHSVRFCVETMLVSLDAIAEATMQHKNNRLYRLTGRLRSSLNYDEIHEVLSSNLSNYLYDVKEQLFQIHDNLFSTYITYPIETAMATS